MKRIIFLTTCLSILFLTLISCTEQNESDYLNISPVVLNISQVPYPKLSDYHFFEGALKNLIPVYKVIPYKPASDLFTDYAQKQRFIWLPGATAASFNGAENTLEFPIGTALIKTFFYDNVQPNNIRKIIETRLLIRKNDSWYTYVYIWNENQTEAYLDTDQNGSFVPITWKENNQIKTVNYKIPSNLECLTCHKINPTQTIGGEITIPIGTKPQNLNNDFNYGNTKKNQLLHWKNIGLLNNMTQIQIQRSTVDYRDTGKSLEQRARSYIDINCAHCHRTGGHCDYVNVRFDYSNTNLQSFGVCMTPLFSNVPGSHVITAGNADDSELTYRISTNTESEMMPIMGRTMIHQEGVQLIKDWINSMQNPCQ